MRKILVIQIRRIGDVLLTTPAMEVLRKHFPNARIDFLAESPAHEVLEGNPFINEVLVYDPRRPFHWIRQIRQRSYDVVIDYLSNPRSALITYLSGSPVRLGWEVRVRKYCYTKAVPKPKKPMYVPAMKLFLLSALGISSNGSSCPLMTLNIRSASKQFTDQTIRELGIEEARPLIGIVPTHRRITRRWLPNRFAELGRRLIERYNAQLLLFWGPGEFNYVQSIYEGITQNCFLSPLTPHLHDLASLLSRCHAVITNCSGPRHISVAMKVPTFTLYGSTDPHSWNPPNDSRFGFLQASELWCIACDKNQCPFNLECQNFLTVDRVERAFDSWWENLGKINKQQVQGPHRLVA